MSFFIGSGSLFLLTSKTRIIFGGRRSGKTQWGAVECTWAGLGIHPYGLYPSPPLQIRICGVDIATTRNLHLPTIRYWLPRGAEEKYWAEDRILELKNGTEIDLNHTIRMWRSLRELLVT
jgi:hypothetical protein